MTLEQLRIFVAVAEALSMTRAAEKLRLTQPAVSAAVAALELRHATRLFERIGRRLELTEAGTLFLPEARAVLTRANESVRVLDDLAGLKRGELRIAASQTVATYWLPPRLARFRVSHPGIRLTFTVCNTAQAAARLLQGEADLGFVEGQVQDPLLRAKAVGGDTIGLYVAPRHPLTGHKPTRKALQAAAWVLREPGSGTRDHFIVSMARAGIAVDALDVRLELSSNGAALEAIKGGELIAVVSDLAGLARQAAGQICRLDWELPPRKFTFLNHRGRHQSRAAAAFLQSL